MRRFVSDFLLPVVRGGAAHVARPLGMSAVERMLRRAAADRKATRWPSSPPAAWRTRITFRRCCRRRRSTRPACAWAPRCTTCSRSGIRSWAAPDRAARIASPRRRWSSRRSARRRSAQRGGEPPFVAGAAARDRARRSHRALLAGAADVRGPPAAAPGDGAARAPAGARRTDQPELAAGDRHPGGGAAGVPRAQRRQPAGRGAGSAPPRSAGRLGSDPARAALSRRWRASSPARR